MPNKTWGTPQIIKEYVVVGDNTEIPAGQKGYVFSQQQNAYELIYWGDWEKFIAGDLTTLKEKIEQDIQGTKVIWIKIAWTKANQTWDEVGYEGYYKVEGFYVEALVENTGSASLTGLEIIGIIIAVAFLAAVIAGIALVAWVTWQVMNSIPDIAKPFVGIGLLILIGLFLLILFGAKLGVSGKGVSLGR